MTGPSGDGIPVTGRVHALRIPFRIPVGPGITVEISVSVHLALGIPAAAANPLVARTVEAHRRITSGGFPVPG